MPVADYTVQELVSMLQHSTLPVVLVEGRDDARIYRWLEKRISGMYVDILPCGGRDKLLQVYDRRSELSSINYAFMADQDMWMFTGIPSAYSSIVWTQGYSIENDIYLGSGIERLFDDEDWDVFRIQLDLVSKWFAHEVRRAYQGGESQVKIHLNQLVPPGPPSLNEAFLRGRGYCDPPEYWVEFIRQDYALKIRGKNVLEMVERVLNRPGRGTRFNREAVLEMCVKTVGDHCPLERLLSELRNKLCISHLEVE